MGDLSTATGTLPAAYNPLYNGNIAHTVNSLQPFTGWSGPGEQGQVLAQVYRYDQLNRLKKAQGVEGLTVAANSWEDVTDAVADRFKSAYTYDANGNIETAKRHDESGQQYDDFTYKYHTAGVQLQQNRLYDLYDGAAHTTGTDIVAPAGIFDNSTIGVDQNNNYSYDELGNLIQDKREEIGNIEWTVAGKVKKLERTPGSTKPELTFGYGADGQRTYKQVGDPLTGGSREYYIRDAQGNIMATYRYTNTGSASLKVTDRPIFGSKRLGSYTRAMELVGEEIPDTYVNYVQPMNTRLLHYELNDHLGNVTAVVTGRLLPMLGPGVQYQAELLSAQGYEAFGSLLPGRNYSSSNYRFGFNGKEKDDEVHGATGTSYDYGFRIYDPRLARFLSLDPLARSFPFYTPYQFAGNKPIKNVDIDGLEELPDDVVRRGLELGKALIRQTAENLVIATVHEVVIGVVGETEHRLDETIKKSDDPEAISYAIGFELVLGIGPESREFGPTHPMSKSLAASDLTTVALKAYYKGYQEYKSGKRSSPPPTYRVDSTYLAPLTGEVGPVIDGDMNAGEFVGTALYTFQHSKDEKTLSVKVFDSKTEYSLLLHLPGTDWHTREQQAVMGETYQIYDLEIPMTDVKKRGK